MKVRAALQDLVPHCVRAAAPVHACASEFNNVDARLHVKRSKRLAVRQHVSQHCRQRQIQHCADELRTSRCGVLKACQEHDVRVVGVEAASRRIAVSACTLPAD